MDSPLFGAPKGGVEMDLPKCQKCNNGILIPLSDYGQDGASVIFKAWACTNPDCGFSLRVDKGEVTYGKKIEPKHYHQAKFAYFQLTRPQLSV
jgi:hypothetical protein